MSGMHIYSADYREGLVNVHKGHPVVFNTKNYIFVLRLHHEQRRNGYTNYVDGAIIFSNKEKFKTHE